MPAVLRSLCVNSQTPLVRFLTSSADLLERFPDLPDPAPIETFVPGLDYTPTAGGVVQVVLPLLRRLIDQHQIDRAYWLSLSTSGPRRILWEGIQIVGIQMEPPELRAYTRAKERLWNVIHGLPTAALDAADFIAFTRYNWECAHGMFELSSEVDLFYVHDFQQLMTGMMIGLSAPAVMRWHIPMSLDRTPRAVRRYIVRGLEGFDAVVVSCRRDLEGLIAQGFRGKARQIYPSMDPARFPDVSEESRAALRKRLSLAEDEPVLLCVGRMDPMKGQDVLVRATRRLLDQHPALRVVLVGDGSFTSATHGGLGASKSAGWRRKVEQVAREENVLPRIVFPGFLSHEELCAAYSLATVVVLPSGSEGFGLVVPEAWMYQRPVVVSQGAGVSELVIDGTNGFTFPAGDAAVLAERLETTLRDPALRDELGRKGRDTAAVCYADNRVPDELQVLGEAREAYK